VNRQILKVDEITTIAPLLAITLATRIMSVKSRIKFKKCEHLCGVEVSVWISHGGGDIQYTSPSLDSLAFLEGDLLAWGGGGGQLAR
jgi:hypothetical protein